MAYLEFFTMPGCPNCAKVKEVLKRIKRDFPDLEIETIDLTKRPEMAQKYNLMGCPAVAVNGRVEFVGGVNEEKLRRLLKD
jgi:small redox-active disulfide protein 1